MEMPVGDLPAPFDPMMADGSPGARAMYTEALQAEWDRLLVDAAFTREINIQTFLERHPSLVPGARGPSMRSGWRPWPSAVITQPRLPDLSTKRPDFMWIASDSAFLMPVLVEIERPDKRWFHDDGTEQHSDLTTALNQIAHWRAWFDTGGNGTQFHRYYRIPRELMDRTIKPHFIVVHGHRSEVMSSPARQRLRSSISKAHDSDTTIMSFDSLSPDNNALDFGTAQLDTDGTLRMVSVPASFCLGGSDWNLELVHAVEGLKTAITSSPDLSEARKSELTAVVDKYRTARSPGLKFGVARGR